MSVGEPDYAKVMIGSNKIILLFTEHVEEYVDVDGEEDEEVKTFPAVLPRHP